MSEKQEIWVLRSDRYNSLAGSMSEEHIGIHGGDYFTSKNIAHFPSKDQALAYLNVRSKDNAAMVQYAYRPVRLVVAEDERAIRHRPKPEAHEWWAIMDEDGNVFQKGPFISRSETLKQIDELDSQGKYGRLYPLPLVTVTDSAPPVESTASGEDLRQPQPGDVVGSYASGDTEIPTYNPLIDNVHSLEKKFRRFRDREDHMIKEYHALRARVEKLEGKNMLKRDGKEAESGNEDKG